MEPGIHILHVDDDPSILDITAELLSDIDDTFEITSATGPDEALDILEETAIDCIVSDYDMGKRDGIEFLEVVRDRYQKLPFILFTGKGSEEVASEAISAGVTDYLQKKGTVDQYTLLANRINNAINAREASRNSKRRMREFETLITSAPVPMAVVNESGDVLYLNGSAQNTLCVDGPRTDTNLSFLEFVHPEDRAARRDSIERAADTREATQTREFRLLTRDGDERIVMGSVVPSAFDGQSVAQLVFTDVTAQREREAELRELNQFREAIIQNASVWISVLDNNGEVVVWNQAAGNISGYDTNEMIGRDDWAELLYPDEQQREAVFEDSREALQRNETIEGYESVITRADGERRRIYWDAHPLTDVSEEFSGVLSVGWDVTETHEQSNQLKLLHERTRQLVNARNRETVAEMTATAAKDILGYEYVTVRLVNAEEDILEPVATTKDLAERTDACPAYPLDGDSPHADALDTGNVVSVADVSESGAVRDGGPAHSEMYLPIGEYGVMTVSDTAVGAFDQSDTELATVLAANVEAILDRLDRQQRLSPIEERMETFLAETTDIITLLDDDGTILYQNPATTEILGYQPTAVQGDSLFEYVHPEDCKRVRSELLGAVQRGATGKRTDKFRLRHAEGSWISVEAQTHLEKQPDLDGYVATIREISEQERQTVDGDNERFSALFENFPEPTVSFRYEDDIPLIQSVNTEFEAVFGFDAEAVTGEPIDDLIVPVDKQSEAKQLDERVQQGELIDDEVRRKTTDGVRTFKFRNIPYKGDAAIDGFGVYNNINERVKHERELTRQNERLDEFAGIIAHDLRNPLNVAQLRAELLAENIESDHLTAVRDAHERMETLLNETLLLARQGKTVADREPVHVGPVLSDCHEMVGTDDSTVAVDADIQIHCDKERIKQLFENLIKNAIEHGNEDVTIRVGKADGNTLYVEDDGPGIPEDSRESVLEPGYTTGEDGIGMGLAIVSSIVEAHGWELTVTESENGGARFEIEGVHINDSR
ncbi:PAS domain S-box protein [Halovenus rubra]|uniref:histidine kinase n=2 Tax=Halovenus rubra TaxID=869890 RepID=A0ABD5X1P4_9EURY|nr:PAS domain S-box protein [Halovenus rubra]